MLKYRVIRPGEVELRGSVDEPIVGLTSTVADDGALRVTATIPRQLADDIIAGIKLLDVVRGATAQPADPRFT